jgi:hypothetical protein
MTELDETTKVESSSSISKGFKKFLEKHPVILKAVQWIVPLFLLFVIIITVYWSWFVKLPNVPEENGETSGLFLLLPIVIIILAGVILEWLSDISDKSFQTLLKMKDERKVEEDKLRESLATSGLGHIVDMITYSRTELEMYYRTGLSQQQKSYRNSIWAMWIGFLVIAVGISLFVVELPYVNQKYLNGEVQILTIGGGVLMELVSGFFLYMYRESTYKLTYLYNRQNVLYDSLICLEISKQEKGDQELKRMIVSNILSQASANVHSSWLKRPAAIAKGKKENSK